MKPIHRLKLWTVFLLLISLLACQKQQITSGKTGDVVFSSSTVSKSSLKTVVLSPDYAIVKVDEKTFKIPVYTVNGKVYTSAIKLDPGNYTLKMFVLMNAGALANDTTDDVPVYALPLAGSSYAPFVSHPAGFRFRVGTLEKEEVPVEVLRFQPEDYQKFGFDFTILPHTTLRHQLFTGRFFPADMNRYIGSLYQEQTHGLQADMPAVFRIDVYRNGHFVKSYGNEGKDETKPLEVIYPDENQNPDQFRFDLYLYTLKGNGFGYRFIHSWYFSDNQLLRHENDGIVHFVIGNTQQQADYIFGPVLNLPGKCTLTVEQGFAPGNLGTYFNGEIMDIGNSYQLSNGTHRFWCGTDSVSINLGHRYTMQVFSSIYPDALPAYARNPRRWNAINWLFNHLDNYPFYDWDILQGACWMILNDWSGTGHSGVSNANSVVLRMASDARQHIDFIPGFGQKAAVIFIPEHTPHEETIPKVQVVMTWIKI